VNFSEQALYLHLTPR